MAVTGIVAYLTTIGTSSVAFTCSAAMAEALASEATQRVRNVYRNRYPDVTNLEIFRYSSSDDESVGFMLVARVGLNRNVIHIFN